MIPYRGAPENHQTSFRNYTGRRRVQRNTSFKRNWQEYKDGFGTPCKDYWLGNKYIHSISMSGSYELRIDMVYKQTPYFAHYNEFYVTDEARGFMLQVSGFTGNSVDEMRHHDNMKFSTPDRDNDLADHSCAQEYEAGWWYQACHFANLNGHFNESHIFGRGVIWIAITSDFGTLDSVEMKIRKRRV
ncbi:hypothetical protein Btru_002565 [Bulinus truncatus]|nr:hypothetical protein Btru_002565 [Bulinus truncatus]